MSLAETTMQLDGLFDRRRDLMYQIGIVTAVASALLQVSNLGPNAQHLGTDSATVIAGFMAISTLVFCIRFVQLHADIMHHGMRFAFAEKSIHNDGFENAIANSRTINLRGVSVQIILLFAVLASTTTSFALLLVFKSIPTSGIGFLLTLALLVIYSYLAHSEVSETQEKFLGNSASLRDGDPAGLQTHYLSSLTQSRLDMICITALSGLQAFANFQMIGKMDELPVNGREISIVSATLFAGMGLLISAICFRIYCGLRVAEKTWSTKAKLEQVRRFRFAMSDSSIGLLVVTAFLAINMGIFVRCTAQWSPSPVSTYSEEIASAIAVVCIALCFVYQNRVLKRPA